MSVSKDVVGLVAGIFGSAIAIELRRRQISTEIFTTELFGFDIFYWTLLALGSLTVLSLGAIVIGLVSRSQTGPRETVRAPQSDSDNSNIIGCILYEGVKWIGTKHGNGNIQIKNTLCPDCGEQLTYLKDMRDEGGVIERKGDVESVAPIPVPGYDCDNPHCDYEIYLEKDSRLEREVHSLFRQHFEKISNNPAYSREKLLKKYKERTGEDTASPHDIWHEYYRLTADDEVCSTVS